MQAFVFQDPDWLLDAYQRIGIFGEGMDFEDLPVLLIGLIRRLHGLLWPPGDGT